MHHAPLPSAPDGFIGTTSVCEHLLSSVRRNVGLLATCQALLFVNNTTIINNIVRVRGNNNTVTINNGVAVTKVTQVFHNTEKRQVEALYTFPVPKSASVANFSMWINGKEMVGEVVEKQAARRAWA